MPSPLPPDATTLRTPMKFQHGHPAPVDPRPVVLGADEANEKLWAVAMQLRADRPDRYRDGADAVKEAARLNTELVAMRDEIAAPEPVASPPLSLSEHMQQATTFIAVVESVQRERNLRDVRDAIALAADLRPDLADAWRTGRA